MEQQTIDYEFWKLVVAIVNLLGVIVVGAYTYVTRQSDQNSKRINEVEQGHKDTVKIVWEKHDELKERVAKLEARPEHDQEIIEIHKRINTVAESQKNLEGRFGETSQAVNRMHDYLINKGS